MAPVRAVLAATAAAAALLGLLLPTPCLALPFDASKFKLPPGFSISLYADGLHAARSLALSGAQHGKATIVYLSSRDFQSPATDKASRAGQVSWLAGS